jgi:NAD-dependent SIR2 family protein deacetylase
MAKEVATSINNFPFKRMADALKRRRKVCVVGYEFSWKSRRAPHFTDIRKGVWSSLSENSTINPFTSLKDYCIVMNWFNCRRQVISASNKAYKDSDKPAVQQSDFFQMLREMQSDLGLIIATQCEDGLMSLNHLENVHELYGNIFQAKCYENGHEYLSWPAHEEICQRLVCETCGSTVFPNVEMFGWNKRIKVRKDLLDQIEKSEALILIGIDKNLAPFNEVDGERFARLPVIELLENGVVLEEKKSVYKASFNEIEKHIKDRIEASDECLSKGTIGYQRAMGYLRQVHKIYAGG